MKTKTQKMLLRIFLGSLLAVNILVFQIQSGASQNEPVIDFRGLNYEIEYLDAGANSSRITEQQIRADLEILQQLNVNHIRTMGTKYGQDLIPQIAAEYEISVATGAWISWNSTDSYLELDRAINVSDDSELIIIGSSPYLRGEVSREQMEDYVDYANSNTDTKIALAETLPFLTNNLLIGLSCDAIIAEIDPFEDLYQLSDIGQYVLNMIITLRSMYVTQDLYVSVGLPSANHDDVSETIQEEFYEDLFQVLEEENIACYMFEAFDVPNRQYYTSSGNSGPHWGIFDQERNPKPAVSVFNEYYDGNVDVPGGKIPSFLHFVPFSLGLVLIAAFSLNFGRKIRK